MISVYRKWRNVEIQQQRLPKMGTKNWIRRSINRWSIANYPLPFLPIYWLAISIRLFLVEEHCNHLFIAPHSVQSYYPFHSQCILSLVVGKRGAHSRTKMLISFGMSLVCPRNGFCDSSEVFHRTDWVLARESFCLLGISRRYFNVLRTNFNANLSTSCLPRLISSAFLVICVFTHVSKEYSYEITA